MQGIGCFSYVLQKCNSSWAYPMCAYIYNYLKIKFFIPVVLRASVHFLVEKFLIQTPFPTSGGVTRSLKMSGSEADGSEKKQSEALRLSQTSWSVWPQISPSLFSFPDN